MKDDLLDKIRRDLNATAGSRADPRARCAQDALATLDAAGRQYAAGRLPRIEDLARPFLGKDWLSVLTFEALLHLDLGWRRFWEVDPHPERYITRFPQAHHQEAIFEVYRARATRLLTNQFWLGMTPRLGQIVKTAPARFRILLEAELAASLDGLLVFRGEKLQAFRKALVSSRGTRSEGLLDDVDDLAARSGLLREMLRIAFARAHPAPFTPDQVSMVLGVPADRTLLAATYRDQAHPHLWRFRRLHRLRGGARNASLRGGQGELWVARDDETGIEVVLKQVRSEGATAADRSALSRAQARLEREALLTARLEHPGVVPVYGWGRDEQGHPSFAMGYIRGGHLGEAIRATHQDPRFRGLGPAEPDWRSMADRPGRLLRAFIRVCYTVAYAHSQWVIHRDLKPHNVMVSGQPDGETKAGRPRDELGARDFGETYVIDWGLARDLSDGGTLPHGPERDRRDVLEWSLAGVVPGAVGTPPYLSPEQALRFLGRAAVDELPPVTFASDVYSLGAILYEILADHPPPSLLDQARFRLDLGPGNTPVVELMAVTGRTRPCSGSGRTRGEAACQAFPGLSPAADFPGRPIPAGLDFICRKATQARPGGRYATADAIADDVLRWLSDEPVPGHADSLPTRLLRLARKNKRVNVAVAATSGLLIVIPVLAWLLSRIDRQDAINNGLEQGVRKVMALDEPLQELPDNHVVRKRLNDIVHWLSKTTGRNDPDMTCALARVAAEDGNIDVALTYYGKSLEYHSTHQSDSHDARLARAVILNRIAWLRRNRGHAESKDLPQAIEALSQSKAILNGLPPSLDRDSALSAYWFTKGDYEQYGLGEYSEARTCYLEAARIHCARLRPEAKNLASSEDREPNAGWLVNETEVVAALKNDPDPVLTKLWQSYAQTLGYLGDVYVALNCFDEALRVYTLSMQIREGLCRHRPHSPNRVFELSRAYFNIGFFHEKRSEVHGQKPAYNESTDHFRRAQKLLDELVELNPQVDEYRGDQAWSNYYLASVKLRSHGPGLPPQAVANEALENLCTARARFRELVPLKEDNSPWESAAADRRGYAWTERRLAGLWLRSGQVVEASSSLKAARALLESLPVSQRYEDIYEYACVLALMYSLDKKPVTLASARDTFLRAQKAGLIVTPTIAAEPDLEYLKPTGLLEPQPSSARGDRCQ